MSEYMYILECADGSYYTGSTVDLERRLFQYNEGTGANYTSKRLPVKLVYFEEYERVDDAFHREKQVQGWSHAKKEALIKQNWHKLHKLAECKNDSHYKNVPSTSTTLGNQGSIPLDTGAQGTTKKACSFKESRSLSEAEMNYETGCLDFARQPESGV